MSRLEFIENTVHKIHNVLIHVREHFVSQLDAIVYITLSVILVAIKITPHEVFGVSIVHILQDISDFQNDITSMLVQMALKLQKVTRCCSRSTPSARLQV